MFSCNCYDFSRKNISYKLNVYSCDRTALRSKEICIVTFPDTKWLESEWISCTNHFSRAAHNKCICTLDLLHRTLHCFFCCRCMKTLSCNKICDYFRVYCCLENSTCLAEFFSQLDRLSYISIVCHRKCYF